MASVSPTHSGVRLKSVALPPEHGAWGFLLEPVVAGLGVAPSWAGLLLSLGVLGAFLLRHPLKIAYQDRRHGRRYARTALAERVALLCVAVAGGGLAGGLLLAGPQVLLPVPLVAPLALLLLISYAQNRGRDLWPQMAGAGALAGTATAVALAGGAATGPALALWGILLGRSFPSILYIRARLRLEKGKPFALAPVAAANGLAVGGAAALAAAGIAPLLAVVALAILLARALVGLSPWRWRVRVQTLGFLELGFGALTVLLTVAGYALGI
jgi:hypothetical protein